MNIAFIGLGNMGGKMAHNLLKAGLTVYGFDLSDVAIAHFTEAGGIACNTPQKAAENADVVITMLPAAKHVKEVHLQKYPAMGYTLPSSSNDHLNY